MHRNKQGARLFSYSITSSARTSWQSQGKRLGCPKVEDQLPLDGLLDR
jgi:hypothetical protein